MISSVLDVLKDKIPIGLFHKINKADNPSKELIKYLTVEEIKEINALLKKKNINFSFSLDEKIETTTTKIPKQKGCIVHTIKAASNTTSLKPQSKTTQVNKESIVNDVNIPKQNTNVESNNVEIQDYSINNDDLG